jgi:succinate dehydrogenase / fumarate reductase iron-sulfur subunit
MPDATLRIFRGEGAAGGQAVDYTVPIAPGMVVLDALHYIQGHQAPDLAVRWNCKAAKCGSCSAEVNGRPRLTCKTRVDSLPMDQPIVVMPMKSFPRVQEFRKCIECFLCQDVCHVLREHDEKQKFGGPRFFVRVAGLELHPLDALNRTGLLKDGLGIGLCNITKCCTEVCPEDIHITDNAIIPLKERVVDQFYDPLTMLFRKITGK